MPANLAAVNPNPSSPLGAVQGADLPPPPPLPVIARAFTGDYRIDVLIDDPNFRWNVGQAVGTPVEVTYSFMVAQPAYGDGGGSARPGSFMAFNDAQKLATRQILARISEFTALSFKEVPDTGATFGQMAFGNNAQGASAGYAFLPNSNQGPGSEVNGDVWIDLPYVNQTTPGTFGYTTLVHEIGHALGLNHPGNYNAGEPANPNAVGNFYGALEDNLAYTVMSYRDVAQAQTRIDFGRYDILTLQYLYGSKPVAPEDTVYRVEDTQGQRLQTFVDSGGTDTLDLSAVTVGARVDLREGAFSSVGRLANSDAARDNLDFALGTVVENVRGTALADVVTGNGSANTFALAGGNDTADGGSGRDVLRLTGNRADYTVLRDAASARITVADNLAGRDGTDVLRSVEVLAFADGDVTVGPLGGDFAVVALGRALGQPVTAGGYAAAQGAFMAQGGPAYAAGVFGARAGQTNQAVATDVLNGVGIRVDTLDGGAPPLSYQALRDALTLFFDIFPTARSQVVLNLTGLLGNLEGNAVYGRAAAMFNDVVASDYYAITLVGQTPTA